VRAPRNIPSLLKSITIVPRASIAITPPLPPSAFMRASVFVTDSESGSPAYCICALMSCATTARMKYSPWPVAEIAQLALSA
jgi:hypothetical protein